MHCLRSLPLMFFAVVSAGAMTACNEAPVGLNCYIGNINAGEGEAFISSPALDCQSRVCLHQPDQSGAVDDAKETDMCTNYCDSSEDCVRHPQSECKTGFACMIPVVVGDFCCQKMCVCKDYIVVPDEGFTTPAACDPTGPSECCNLPGRDACGLHPGGGGGGVDAMP